MDLGNNVFAFQFNNETWRLQCCYLFSNYQRSYGVKGIFMVEGNIFRFLINFPASWQERNGKGGSDGNAVQGIYFVRLSMYLMEKQ